MRLEPGFLLQGGKYRIVEPLGQGGFGITYLAEQPLMQRRVCVKEFFMKEYCNRDLETGLVSPASAANRVLLESMQEKFLREARIIASLDHPNVIRIHDVFTENGTAYYVMEYIEGKSLNELVRERGRIPEEEAIGYIQQVGEGLSYLHSRKINHLDINGGNVMLRSKDHRAILIDFGLSRRFDETEEETTYVSKCLSEGFAPLEMYQVSGPGGFSPQTDIYGLGATLYRLVTGRIPPAATEIVSEGLPEFPKAVSTRTRAAIEKAMAVKKKDRPSTIGEFLSLLDQLSPAPPRENSIPLLWKAAVICGCVGVLLMVLLHVFMGLGNVFVYFTLLTFLAASVLAAFLLVRFDSVLPETLEKGRDRVCCLMGALIAPLGYCSVQSIWGSSFRFVAFWVLSLFFLSMTLLHDWKRKSSMDLMGKGVWWTKAVFAVLGICIFAVEVVSFLFLNNRFIVTIVFILLAISLSLSVIYAVESLVLRFRVSRPGRTEVCSLILFSVLWAFNLSSLI